MGTKKKKGLATAAIIGLAAAVLAMGIFMYAGWRSYQGKMEILYVALQQEGEGKELIDTVAGFLKGQIEADTKSAEQKLGHYGYRLPFQNQYEKQLYRDWEWTAAVFGLLYLGFLASLYVGEKRRGRDRHEELLWLEHEITNMRDGGAGLVPVEESGGRLVAAEDGNERNVLAEGNEKRAVLAEGNEKRAVLAEGNEKRAVPVGESGEWLLPTEGYDEDLGRLLMEFDALRDSMLLLRRQAKAEKEETKALVTDISHQLKTPVAAFRTSFEVLQSEGLREEEKQEFLGRCRIQMERLEELVGALMNISRMETGMIEIQRKETNLFDTLLLAVSRIYPKAEEKGIAVELEAEDALKQMDIFHDAKWLCEAFLDVLENAVKYSGNQTKITIRMIKLNVFLRIEIEDEGIGIPKGEWNRIFQRFYRGRAKEVQEASGSGVGLYLAREIVARQGGTLVAAPPRRKQRGSCFVFQLPYLQEGAAMP